MRAKYYSFLKRPNRHNAASLMSYYGWVKHTNSYILFNKYFKDKLKMIKEAL
jgi:hypothetical protein